MDVLEADEVAGDRKRWPSPLVAPRRTAVWPMPTALLPAEGSDHSLLATAFGEGRLRRLERSAIPAGVVHSQTLATLTCTGFPAVDDGSEPKWLTTVDLDQTGLEPLDAPGHTEPAYLLGYWLGEKVFLGGDSGRVLLASVAGVQLLGSSLRQFITLVSLYITLRRSEFSTRYEEEDARRSLAAWARHIDQPAGSSRSWTAAFDGDLDVPESLCEAAGLPTDRAPSARVRVAGPHAPSSTASPNANGKAATARSKPIAASPARISRLPRKAR